MFSDKVGIPSSIDMKDDTRVKVEFEGSIRQGTFRGPAPDGSYAVRLDGEQCLRSFEAVELDE